MGYIHFAVSPYLGHGEYMKRHGQYRCISDEQRYKDATLVAVMVAFIVGALVIGGFAFNDRAYLGWSIVASVVGMLFVYYIFQHKRTFIPTPPDQIVLTDDEIVEKGEARAKWERIEKCWWFRYSIAGLMFLGAWFLFVTKPQLWWVSAVAVINGLVLLTREIRYLAVFGLVCIVALIAFSVIASLPVSLAVIIGALIIAGAVSR